MSKQTEGLEAKTILSNNAYSIRKSAFPIETLNKIRKELTVLPLTHPDYPIPKKFSVYNEGLKWLRVPRYYGEERFGLADKNLLQDHPITNVEFKGCLRESQLIPYEKVMQHLRQKNTGVLSLMTGSGKTVLFLSILAQLKQRTCILVHKSQLLHQWKEELERFLPMLSIGIIQQTKKDFSAGHDVYIVMIQTFLNIQKIPHIFGFIGVDEAHHTPSETFSKILFKTNAKYLLGLSATPKRKDGLTKVLHWHLGPIIYEEKPNRKGQKTSECRIYRFQSEALSLSPKQYSTMITKICNCNERNEYILEAIKKVLLDDKACDRRILILTERKNHATYLYSELSLLENFHKRTCGLMLGGMKTDHMEEQKKKMIIVATYNLMSEGISIEALNTIVFASPKRDVVQALGRIFRKQHLNIHPMIVDISDVQLSGQEKSRVAIYKRELNDNITLTYYDEEFNITYTTDSMKVGKQVKKQAKKQGDSDEEQFVARMELLELDSD